MRGFSAAAALSLAFVAVSAHSQYYGGASSSDLLGYRSSVGHYYSRSVGTNVRTRSAQRPGVRRPPAAPGRSAATPAPAPRPALGSTVFRPVAPSLYPKQLAAAVPRNPEAESYFNTLLARYKELLQERRIAPNDVARAASFLISTSYSVLNGGKRLNETQLNGLRAQVHEIMAADPEFQRLSDREKQQLYEKYAIFAMHLETAQSLYGRTGDKKELANNRALAREQLEDTFGLPVDRLVVRDDGLYAR